MSTLDASEVPLGLGLVIDYVNTLDIERGEDALAMPADLTRWLIQRGLLAPGSSAVSKADQEAAIRLREALRSLMLANNGGDPAADAWSELEQTARRGELAVGFVPGGVLIAPRAGGIPGALATLLRPVAAAIDAGVWERVKACRASDCLWAFYDRSRNRSGTWCDMAVCGNRTKVRTYRARSAARRR